MNTLGPIGVSSFYNLIPGVVNTRGITVGPVSPTTSDDTAGSSRGSVGTGASPAEAQTAPAQNAGVTVTIGADAAAVEAAAADDVIAMPATPLAHILVQLRNVVKAQRAATEVTKAIASSGPTPGQRVVRGPEPKTTPKEAAKAYAKVQRMADHRTPAKSVLAKA